MASYGLAPLSREYGGALSDLVEVPFADAMLVPLPTGVEPAAAASASDNIPDGWRAVAPFLARRSGAPVLVLGGAGGGSVGLYAAAVAVALGSERVDYVDEDPARLAVAERVGANAMQEPVGKRYGPYPITVNHTTEPSGLTTALRSTEPGGTCTSTTIYFGSDISIPMLEMYTTGVTLATSRVSARAVMPDVLGLIASGRLHPELVTDRVVEWTDAAEALAVHTHKTVVVRADA
jgi:alcohol dehydrogenase